MLKKVLCMRLFCKNCSHFILKWFQPNSLGEVCFLEECTTNMQKISHLKNFWERPLFNISEYALKLFEEHDVIHIWKRNILQIFCYFFISSDWIFFYPRTKIQLYYFILSKLKGALDNFSLIPNFFFKKVEIFISLEVFTYVVTAC